MIEMQFIKAYETGKRRMNRGHEDFDVLTVAGTDREGRNS
jgi:hypothetical protein